MYNYYCFCFCLTWGYLFCFHLCTDYVTVSLPRCVLRHIIYNETWLTVGTRDAAKKDGLLEKNCCHGARKYQLLSVCITFFVFRCVYELYEIQEPKYTIRQRLLHCQNSDSPAVPWYEHTPSTRIQFCTLMLHIF